MIKLTKTNDPSHDTIRTDPDLNSQPTQALPAANPDQPDRTADFPAARRISPLAAELLLSADPRVTHSDEPAVIFEIISIPMDSTHEDRIKSYARLLDLKDTVVVIPELQPA